MPIFSSQKPEWCYIYLLDQSNWWVSSISNENHWDLDTLGIIDPKQVTYILDLCESLREYGFDFDAIDDAFFIFRIEGKEKDDKVRLRCVKESILKSEDPLFALPNLMDEERGPYADFIKKITRYRVKLLNDLIEMDHFLTMDDIEDEIREMHVTDTMSESVIHPFSIITTILEYVPKGFELDEEDGPSKNKQEEHMADIPDIDLEEKIVEDDTMIWDEEENEENEENEEEEEK